MAKEYYIQIFGNVQRTRTEAEIYVAQDPTGGPLATVYDSEEGWCVDYYSDSLNKEDEKLDAVIEAAKEDLSHYVNRLGHDPPEGISAIGLSLWLMLKDDGTALGKPVDWA